MKHHVFLWGLLAAATLSASVSGHDSASTTISGHEFSAAARDRQGVIDVEGKLLLPGGSSRVRGIITVLQWGVGTLVYDDAAWRQLAADLRLGFLRLAVTNHGGPADPLDLPTEQQAVRNASLGGAEALLTLLSDLARQTGHPELQDAKLLFWGHSAAGSFAPSFTAVYPTRTIAFVTTHILAACPLTSGSTLRCPPSSSRATKTQPQESRTVKRLGGPLVFSKVRGHLRLNRVRRMVPRKR